MIIQHYILLLLFYFYSLCAEIWDALRAAAEADLSLAQAIVDSAGIIVSSTDMTLCYDERGDMLFYSLCYIFLFYRFFSKSSMHMEFTSHNLL